MSHINFDKVVEIFLVADGYLSYNTMMLNRRTTVVEKTDQTETIMRKMSAVYNFESGIDTSGKRGVVEEEKEPSYYMKKSSERNSLNSSSSSRDKVVD